MSTVFAFYSQTNIIFSAKYLWERVSPAMPLIAAALLMISVAQLLKTSFSDPGVVPRATKAEMEYVEQQITLGKFVKM